ncbi:MAG: hypothetical protein NTV97_36295 [Alphaproteobacteria bacterium]|nr:hypothetical protein [Alphaproteobacteria bacterium]
MTPQFSIPALPDISDSRGLSTPIDSLPEYLSDRQAAFILGTTPADIRRRVRAKALKGRIVGRDVYPDTQAVRMAYHALRLMQVAA